MALIIDADKGLLQLAAEPYDEAIVDWIRSLPQRRYRRQTHDWCIPARREYVLTVHGVIAELEERGIAVETSATAAARLARADIGRAVLRGRHRDRRPIQRAQAAGATRVARASL